MMGRGEASGEKRVLNAAVAAISNPLIENPSIKRASGLIVSITGGNDLSLFEVDEAATRIREEADPDANIIVGATFDESLQGIVRVSVVATGIDNPDPTARHNQRKAYLQNLPAGCATTTVASLAGSSVMRRRRHSTKSAAPRRGPTRGSAGPRSVRPRFFRTRGRGKGSRDPGLPGPQGRLTRRQRKRNPPSPAVHQLAVRHRVRLIGAFRRGLVCTHGGHPMYRRTNRSLDCYNQS